MKRLFLIGAAVRVLTSVAYAADDDKHFPIQCTVISGSDVGVEIGMNYEGEVFTKGITKSRNTNFEVIEFTKTFAYDRGTFVVGMKWTGYAHTKYRVDKSVTFVNVWRQDPKASAKGTYTETLLWNGKVKSKTVSRCIDQEAD